MCSTRVNKVDGAGVGCGVDGAGVMEGAAVGFGEKSGTVLSHAQPLGHSERQAP